jgi:type I restriction enzyme S subunit
MEEWKEYKLSEIATMKNGKKRPQGSGFFPVYGGNGIMDNTDSFNSERTIIVGRVGAYCGCVYKCDGKCWVSDNAIAVYAKDLVDFFFLYYLMTTLDFHHHHIGGAQPLMTQDIIGDFTIKLPSLSVQKEIVFILKAIDDKIECNRQINDNFALSFLLLTCFVLWLLKLRNDNLLKQARALYKSWFVDFEPFKNGEFEDSELGMIPHGWSVKQLGEITKQLNEKVKERVDVKVLSPITTGELVLSEEYFTKQVFSESISKYIVVKPTDFAYNPARVNIGSLGMNEYDFDGCVSPVYVVFRCEDGYQYFFDLFRRTEAFKEEVRTRAIGGVRQSLAYKDFSLIKVVYPPIDVIHSFNQVYSRILAKTKHNNVETTRLASIRDTLLPKLISGELKIS